MFFKRISRSRSNSQSYADSHQSPHDSKASSGAYADERYSTGDYEHVQRPSESRQSNQAPPYDDALEKETAAAAAAVNSTVPTYHRQSTGSNNPQRGDSYDNSRLSSSVPRNDEMSGGYTIGSGGYNNAENIPPMNSKQSEPMPELLLQAFNQVLRPYTDKTESLEGEIADLRAYIDQLEGQRNEIFAWIDKRGLRPDVPLGIARQMDTSAHASSPTHGAATLNAQLDRKITIVNFDLHRLQDDLNDSLPTPSFSACMLKFLPDIARLSALPSGPRYAFDLILKLGGNLNSHGGLENGDEEDLAERRAFYGRLDEAMVDVVKGRFREEGDSWGVQREIKRIEKTGAYLRNWGVEPYFPRTLIVMRDSTSQTPGAAVGNSPTFN